MRELDKGRDFIVTRNGVPVGELHPFRHRVFVPADAVDAAFQGPPCSKRSASRALDKSRRIL